MAYMYYFEELSLFYKLAFGTLITATLVIIGAMLENKPWVKYLEHGRLALIALSLNSLYYLNYQDWFAVMLIASVAGALVFAVWYTWRFIASAEISTD
jgi:hypothetical protein